MTPSPWLRKIGVPLIVAFVVGSGLSLAGCAPVDENDDREQQDRSGGY